MLCLFRKEGHQSCSEHSEQYCPPPQVPGVGTIVAGTLKKGTLTPNMTLLMGPDIEGGLFKPVSIKSIHYKRMPVTHVVAGQTAALALKKTKKNQVRL